MNKGLEERKVEKKWKYLSLKDRFYIEKSVQNGGISATDLSHQLGVSYSTVYYELRRCPLGKYTAEVAEKDKFFRKFEQITQAHYQNKYPKKKAVAVKKLVNSIDFQNIRIFYETYTETQMFPQGVNENLKKLLTAYSVIVKSWTLAKASEMTGIEEKYIKEVYYFAMREGEDLWKDVEG